MTLEKATELAIQYSKDPGILMSAVVEAGLMVTQYYLVHTLDCVNYQLFHNPGKVKLIYETGILVDENPTKVETGYQFPKADSHSIERSLPTKGVSGMNAEIISIRDSEGIIWSVEPRGNNPSQVTLISDDTILPAQIGWGGLGLSVKVFNPRIHGANPDKLPV